MTGIDPKVTTHKLQVDPSFKPVRQKRRRFSEEKNAAINEEVQKLLKIGSVREVRYPSWLANVVVVKKKNGKDRVCVDYTDLNKACPKDPYPLPHIDVLVNATIGHEVLSFMDAFSGYNQIRMDPEDEEHTAFMTNQGIYCYRVMPFGLKNAGSTYQRLVNKMFEPLLGKTMEVYIDDMLVKSLSTSDHCRHLEEAFDILDKYNMKLNPKKCTFGITAGKFLGYVVTKRGLEADPDQIRAVQALQHPSTPKEVQTLAGKMAALSRFISRYSDRTLPFFAAIKKGKRFEWTEECTRAFEELKTYLANPPVLSKAKEGETLLLYLATSDRAVSAVLVREEKLQQHPVYYVSKSLLDAETRYTALEQLVLALVTAVRKLRHYFEAHHVKVVTAYPLRTILGKPDLSGRMMKWAVELGGCGLEYEARTSIKSQVLADFVADFTPALQERAEKEMVALAELSGGTWTLHIDGASNRHGNGAGLVLRDPNDNLFERSIRLNFDLTNNEAEYEALVAGLVLARGVRADSIEVRSDSQLMVNQLRGDFQVKEGRLAAYHTLAKRLGDEFRHFNIQHVPREDNHHADALATLATASTKETDRPVPVIHSGTPATEDLTPSANTVHFIDESSNATWLTPLHRYLLGHRDALSNEEMARVQRQAPRYTLIEGVLYRKTLAGVYLRCIAEPRTFQVLEELHAGDCGNHAGARNLARRAYLAGFWWPTMQKDSEHVVRRCDKCQRFANNAPRHAEPLHYTIVPWPFMKWGLDIVGKLPRSTGQKEYLLIATDYFTKWVEAEPLSRIRDREVINFIWKHILCRFGVPQEIHADNGTQFASARTQQYCEHYGIRLTFSTPRYPEANGLAESTNKTIVGTLKKRLEKHKKDWVDELDGVLWSYRATPRTSTGTSPFALAYGVEAVSPAEMWYGSPRVLMTRGFQENSEEMERNLDFIEEKRDEALRMLELRARQVERSYNKNLFPRSLKVGDLVLRRVFQNTQELNAGKLGPNWEGPYEVSKVVGNGAYALRTMAGKDVPNSWNIKYLRLYHT